MLNNPLTHQAKSRPLTLGERQMARRVFGAALVLDDVRLKTAWWVLKGYAVAPDGNIYFHPSDWCDDFCQKNLAHRAWLIHELTHVWQRQQGICVFWRALFNRRYRYRLKADKSFWRYGVEQQARMVEDFYIRCERGEDCTAWRQCIPFLADLPNVADLSNPPNTTNHDNDAKT